VAHHIKQVMESGVPSSELPSHPGCDQAAVVKVMRSIHLTRSFQVRLPCTTNNLPLFVPTFSLCTTGAPQAGCAAPRCFASASD
jgi:hypothetical protein